MNVLVAPDIPYQSNDHDSGVFLLMFIKYTTLNHIFDFNTDQIESLRSQLIDEIRNKNIPHIQTIPKQSETIKPCKKNSLNVDDSKENEEENPLQRRIINKDLTSCWLNSCLQLLQTVFDASSSIPEFNSDLVQQLKFLKETDKSKSLDPSLIKQLLVEADNKRIEDQKEYYKLTIKDPHELRRRLRYVEELRRD